MPLLNQEQAIAAHELTSEDEIRAELKAQGLDSLAVEVAVRLILKYGPAVYHALTGLLHRKHAAS